jgi:UrcA family protein
MPCVNALTELHAQCVQHDSRRETKQRYLKEIVMKINKYTRPIVMTSIVAIGTVSAAISAHADQMSVNAPARTVHYSDLNLNTPAGASVLYKRIRSAAEQVCGDVRSRQLAEAAAAKACVDQAVYTSVHSVNSVKLTNAYNTRMGVTQPINVASIR